MKIEVRGLLLFVTEPMREHVERRLRFSLGRFAPRIAQVTVRVGDTNGPRGGVDKICRIALTLKGADDVVIEDVDSDLYVAVDRAAERAGRTLQRRLARHRDLQRAATSVRLRAWG